MRITQTLASPTRRFAELLAAVLVGVYLVACLVLYIQAGDNRWDNRIKIFEALGPLVGLAVGWVFGKEVHRQAATDAKRDADRGHELAGAVRAALRNCRKSNDAAGTETTGKAPDDANSSASLHLESLAEEADRLFGTG